MSYRINNLVVIEDTGETAKCESCGKMDDLRPYGNQGQCICYECGEKIPEIVERNMAIQLFGYPGELI